MRYIVYKASIDTYRIIDKVTGEFAEDGIRNIVLHNVRPMVNASKYDEARENNFKNSSDKRDFFAYLECEGYEAVTEPNIFGRLSSVLFYNPFKGKRFADKVTGQEFYPYNRFRHVFIQGNELRYISESRDEMLKRIESKFLIKRQLV